MAEPERFETYSDYIDYLWRTLHPKPDPRTLTRLIAAECCWMQEPNDTAASARPDLNAIDGWAKKIEGTKAFGRMMNSPNLMARVAKRDAEGLMKDLHSELTAAQRARQAERERKREQERKRREQKQREQKQQTGGQKRRAQKPPEKKGRGVRLL